MQEYLQKTKEFYRERIINLISSCEDEHWLRTIYAYIRKLLE